MPCGLTSPFSLRPAPWAGRPDPEGVHGPELSPGRALAGAEDPSRPQHAGPAVIQRWGGAWGLGGYSATRWKTGPGALGRAWGWGLRSPRNEAEKIGPQCPRGAAVQPGLLAVAWVVWS